MTHQPLPLRELIGRRFDMQVHGRRIILLLLRAFQQLRRASVAVRGIDPTSVRLSHNLENLMLSDIKATCLTTTEDKKRFFKNAPYSAKFMPEFSHLCMESEFWDQWSIGVIILEILLGTDLVLATNSFDDIASLFQDCSEFLDKATWTLIEALLFK